MSDGINDCYNGRMPDLGEAYCALHKKLFDAGSKCPYCHQAKILAELLRTRTPQADKEEKD